MVKYLDIQNVACNVVTGNQTISLRSGFGTPVAAFFLITKTVAASAAGGAIGVGMTDGTAQFSATISTKTGVATTDCKRRASNTKCISLLVDGVVDAEAAFVSFGSDAVTINWTNAPGSAWKLEVWALTEVANVKALAISQLDNDFDPRTHTLGFEPTGLIGFGIGSQTVGSILSEAHLAIGMAAGSGTNQATVTVNSNDAAAKTEATQLVTQSKWYQPILSGAKGMGLAIHSFIPTGFKTSKQNPALFARADCYCLAFDTVPVKVIRSLSRSGFGVQAISGVGFGPGAHLMVTTDIDSTDEDTIVATTDAATMSIGAAIDTPSISQQAIYIRDLDFASTSDSESGNTVLRTAIRENSAGSAQTQISTNAFTADGVTLGFLSNHLANAIFYNMFFGGETDAFIETLHGIEHGIKPSTAAGMNGVLL